MGNECLSCKMVVDNRIRAIWRWFDSCIFTHLAALFCGVLIGVLISVYQVRMLEFVEKHGVGEFALKFAPVFGPVLGVTVFWWQVRRARYSQRIDLILKMSERFDKPEMKAIRARAAKALLLNRNTREDAVSQVLDFFEEIGFLMIRGAIDEDAVYTFFDYWVVRYCLATKVYREDLNNNSTPADMYSHTSQLFHILVSRGDCLQSLGANKIDDFLRDESRFAVPERSKF